ncbi:MAG TPA: Na-translocating system protein MpsC family protein [Solirubrobacteraceae bacterium]|nr:Na-translocating system protein MpsC family protein [Solirubrobacteraceae bacterium]
MADPDHRLTGEGLLEGVTEALSRAHDRYYGRRPAAARSRLIDGEMLVCVMGGVYSEVEKTLIELQERPLVDGIRGEFQHAMRDQLVASVERLSGRTVETFISTNHVGPDLEIEIFVLAP